MTESVAIKMETQRMSSRSRGIRRAAITSMGARVVSVIVTLVATPVIITGLGDSRYGVFAAVTMVSSLLAFSDFGVGNGLVTRLAAAEGAGDRNRAQQLVSSATVILIGAGALVGAASLTLALTLPVDRLLGAPATDGGLVRTTVIAYACLFAVGIPMALGQRLLTAMQFGGQAATWSCFVAVTSSALAASAANRGMGLLVVVTATMLPPIIIGAFQSWFVLWRQFPWLRPTFHNLERTQTVDLTKSASGFLILQLAIAVGFQTDIFVIASLLGSVEAARYALALRLFSLVSMLSGLISAQFWAAAAEALARREISWVRRTYRRLTLVTLVAGAAGSITLVAGGQRLVHLWVGASLVPPESLLILMACWTTWVALLQPTAMLLNGSHVLKVQVLIAIAMATINLPLSILLTRRMGIDGPVLGSLIASVATTGIPSWLASRKVLEYGRSPRHSVAAKSRRSI